MVYQSEEFKQPILAKSAEEAIEIYQKLIDNAGPLLDQMFHDPIQDPNLVDYCDTTAQPEESEA
jgi:hypothetical protein